MDAGLLFSLASLLYLAGTILLARKVIKNRDALKDFDYYGSALNATGMTASVIALIGLKLYVATILSMPTLIFWMMAAVYSFKNRRLRNGK